MKLNKAIALRIREILKEKKMTQYKLANRALSQHYDRYIELQISNT